MTLRLIAIVLLVAAAASGQPPPDWVQLNPAGTPTSLTGHVLVSQGGSLVMFGGNAAGTYIDETWLFDGTTWAQLVLPTRPAPRRRHGGTYDTARSRLVVFGGEDNSGLTLNDTWEFDGMAWTLMTPTTVPPARRDHAMAYDVASGVVLMFSGRDTVGTLLGDLWAWDGINWTQLTPTPLPSPRWDGQMAWDGANGNVVLYGGNGGVGLADTWLWSAGTWTQVTPTSNPGALYTQAMTYDAARGRVVCFGGYSPDGTYSRDTWEWDGAVWTQRAASPPPPRRGGPKIAYDAALGGTYLYGGWFGSMYSDTWMLRANRLWQGNQAAASLDLDGNPAGPLTGPSRLTLLPGATGTVNLSSMLTGNPWDIALATAPARPRGLGGFPLGSQIVNLDLSTLAFTMGGTFTMPWSGTSLAVPISAGGALVASAQMIVVDPAQTYGFGFSGPGELAVVDCVAFESFDGLPTGLGSLPAGWTTPVATAAWQLRSGATPTANTGPASDHTTGIGQYLYCEAGAVATPGSFIVDLGSQSIASLSTPTLDLWLHMHGYAVGTFFVEEFAVTTWSPLATFTGDQGMAWRNIRAAITPTPSGTVQLRLRYTSAGASGDVAVDDVAFCN